MYNDVCHFDLIHTNKLWHPDLIHSPVHIENEYRQIEKYYGEKGKLHANWAENMALSLSTSTP